MEEITKIERSYSLGRDDNSGAIVNYSMDERRKFLEQRERELEDRKRQEKTERVERQIRDLDDRLRSLEQHVGIIIDRLG